MLSLLQNHSGEYRTGAYFLGYPTLPLNEAGRVFRFKEISVSGTEEDAITNLEYSAHKKTVSTTYGLPWKEKAYVLIGDTVWRIVAWSAEETDAHTVMPMKRVQRRYTIELMRVDNPSEVRL